MNACGVLLAGGRGRRMGPLTVGVSKHWLAVYDKPLIYYPLTTLMSLGVRDVLVITRPDEQDRYRRLLGAGRQWGMRLTYAVQRRPRGLADAFRIGARFLKGRSVWLALGDNVFTPPYPEPTIVDDTSDHVTILATPVRDAARFGVVWRDARGRVRLAEKPRAPRSTLALTGLSHWEPGVVARARALRPSRRGELELVALLRPYAAADRLTIARVPRGARWFDAGTPEALWEAGAYVRRLHARGTVVGSPDLAARRNGWIERTN